MILLRALGELFLPPVCAACDGACGEEGESGLCRACLDRLAPLSERLCQRCGRFLFGEVCRACRQARPPWRNLVLLGRYDGVLGAAIRAGKIGERYEVIELFARRLAARLPGVYDAVVAVPSDHDFAGRLADRLAARVGAARVEALRRLPDSRRQVGLSRRERRRNAPLAFGRLDVEPGQVVLLVDDIMTTGATVESSTRLLKEAGAQVVDVAVLARA